MTIKEWITDKFNLLGFQCPDSVVLAVSSSLDLDDEVDDVAIEEMELNLLNYLAYMMASPKSISESGFSISRGDLVGLYKALFLKYKDKHNLKDTMGVLNSIEDKTDVW